MNTANKLTMLRVIMIPVFITLLYIPFEINSVFNNISIAFIIFSIAGFTDLADGMIARRRNQVTDFGAFMDPLADKILTFAALIWFVEVEMIPAWIVLVVIMREFVVTGIRLVAAAKGSVISASPLGKIKTILTIYSILVMFAIYNYIPYAGWLLIVCWVLIGASTLASGVEYYVKNKEIMKQGDK